MAEVAQFAVAMFCNAVLFKVVRSWLQQAKRVQQELALLAAGLVSASPLLALLSHKELNLCKVLLYTRAVLVCIQKLVALGVLSDFPFSTYVGMSFLNFIIMYCWQGDAYAHSPSYVGMINKWSSRTKHQEQYDNTLKVVFGTFAGK